MLDLLECELILKSHLTEGNILLNDNISKLEIKNYSIKFKIEKNESKKIVSLKNLPIGINSGVEIVSFKINDVNITSLKHIQIKDICYFIMKNNPYVENKTMYEKNFVFNGDLICSLNLDKIFWFPWYFSKKKEDFVYYNNISSCLNDDGCYHGEKNPHKDSWTNIPFLGIEKSKNNKIALGGSTTYGTGVSKKSTWPALLGFSNFGVPAAGIDSVYFNLVNLLKIQKVQTVIILFPNLHRQSLFFERFGFHFNVPLLSSEDGSLENDYFWISYKEIKKMMKENILETINDKNNSYSIEYLKKIADLPCDCYVSSEFPETYKVLPSIFNKVLPFFETIDKANDYPPHPGPLSHLKWANTVKKLLKFNI